VVTNQCVNSMGAIYGKRLHSFHRCLKVRIGGRANVGWGSDSVRIKKFEST
jgi:hypothetical protein